MRIVINGCFDNFHGGHRYLISEALRYARGGYVFIFINDDNSVTSLKGEDRPIVKCKDREEAVNDYTNLWSSVEHEYPNVQVLSFSREEDLAYLIDRAQPDMIIKGNDRTEVKEIVGSDKWPVLIIPRIKDNDGVDISTTNILKENMDD